MPVAELAEWIKALKAAHTIDAAPGRTAGRRVAAEEPVTARIRRRTVAAPAIEPPAATEPMATAISEPFDGSPEDHPASPRTTFRKYISRDRQRQESPLGVS